MYRLVAGTLDRTLHRMCVVHAHDNELEEAVSQLFSQLPSDLVHLDVE